MDTPAVTPTPRFDATLERAAQLAREKGHAYVGTEHLLLALLDDTRGIAGQVLNRVGVADSIRQAIETIMADPLYRTPSQRIFRSESDGLRYAPSSGSGMAHRG